MILPNIYNRIIPFSLVFDEEEKFIEVDLITECSSSFFDSMEFSPNSS